MPEPLQFSKIKGKSRVTDNFFPTSIHPCCLRKQLLDFTGLQSQLHNGWLTKYRQNQSWASLGARDPGWRIRQEVEDLTTTRAQRPSSALGSSWTVNQPKSLLAEKAPQSIAGTVPFAENTGVDGLTFSVEKCFIRKFPDSPNSQSAFWIA